MSPVLGLVLFSILACSASASPRKRRQAHVEFAPHFFPWKAMCAEKLNVQTANIVRARAFGIPRARFCAHFVLECRPFGGNVTRYLEQCGVGMWWSFKIQTCDIPSMVGRPECVRSVCPPGKTLGVRDPRACYGFYECEAGSAFFEMCEDKSAFDPVTQSCENSPTCDRPAPRTKPNGMFCTEADLPAVCTPPGYLPSLAYCGCVHQHLER